MKGNCRGSERGPVNTPCPEAQFINMPWPKIIDRIKMIDRHDHKYLFNGPKTEKLNILYLKYYQHHKFSHFQDHHIHHKTEKSL